MSNNQYITLLNHNDNAAFCCGAKHQMLLSKKGLQLHSIKNCSLTIKMVNIVTSTNICCPECQQPLEFSEVNSIHHNLEYETTLSCDANWDAKAREKWMMDKSYGISLADFLNVMLG